MKVSFLGTGTSQGIPVVGCACNVCSSTDPKDNRLRCAVMISHAGKNIVIDAGPDFRQQMLNQKVKNVEAILITHEHNDHIIGLDDVRPFNFMTERNMEVYTSERTGGELKQRFSYIFKEDPYPGAPRITLNIIKPNHEFELLGLKITPIEVMHGQMPILGFRIGDFTYITDAKTISKSSLEKIKGTKILVLNALRHKQHHSHLTLEEAIELAQFIKPESAYFTHFSHWIGTHEEIAAKLPNNIYAAHDGLVIKV